jgi:pyruvate-ferredoxin/flavodoxin oxidoreductase
VAGESRFAILENTQPERARLLGELAQQDVDERWRYYEQLASMRRSVPHVHHGPGAMPAEEGAPRPAATGDEA